MKQWHRSHSKQSELNVEKKLHIASHYIANAGCHSSKMIRRKTKDFSWRFVQFAENGTTRDVKIFLWPFFVTKKKLLYGNARNVNKSRNMKLPFTDEEWHTLEAKSGSFKSHTYMKNYFGQFWNKIKKVVFVFRKFSGKCPRWSSFLEKLQTLLLATF